jgi:pyrimidine deaminase RibD-like protein
MVLNLKHTGTTPQCCKKLEKYNLGGVSVFFMPKNDSGWSCGLHNLQKKAKNYHVHHLYICTCWKGGSVF